MHSPQTRAEYTLSLICLLLFLPLLSGCEMLGYYAQSINGQLDLLQKRRPIESLLLDNAIDPELKQRLRRVVAIREFASQQLALPDNDSYLSYAELQREAVVWSLVATPEFSVKPISWCYPVVGCAAYRGYFDKRDAEAHGEQLAAQGYDQVVNPVPAYSTLGWFDDPITSSVIRWSEPRLAALIFHELAHQKLYVQGDSAFNEAFATQLARIGVQAWLEQEAPEKLEQWHRQRSRSSQFTQLLLQSRASLAVLYAEGLPASQMRQRKQALFDQLRRRYQALKAEWGGYSGFDHWFRRPLNNALLASLATYESLVPGLEALYRQQSGDLERFYAACEALAELPLEARHARLRP
ncbi:aminopeptidase [endosymbiont of Riftia pachyptila]|nr:aminopeptidase [endosymbiont of Riftia pachyptila]